jgi:TetR/AcrR family transcriptional regulator, cholesterol catabolism regulator
VSERREEIVAIAKGLIAERGYVGTSTRDIADACGMLPGSLYSHFRSKAQILDLVIGPFYDDLLAVQEAALAEGGSGVEQLERMIRRVTRLCAAHGPELRILHYDWPHFARNEELADLLAQSTRTLELWHRVVAAGLDDGTLRATVDPEAAIRVITSSIHGVLDRQRYGSRPDVVRAGGVEDVGDELVAILVGGLRA